MESSGFGDLYLKETEKFYPKSQERNYFKDKSFRRKLKRFQRQLKEMLNQYLSFKVGWERFWDALDQEKKIALRN